MYLTHEYVYNYFYNFNIMVCSIFKNSKKRVVVNQSNMASASDSPVFVRPIRPPRRVCFICHLKVNAGEGGRRRTELATVLNHVPVTHPIHV